MQSKKAQILAKLAALNNKKANKYLADFINEEIKQIKKARTNDQIFESLKLLKEYFYRVPTQAIEIIEIILKKKPIKPKVVHHFVDADLYGKTHEDLLLSSVEILNSIRYYKPDEVLQLLLKFYDFDNSEIKKEVIKTMEHLVKYNLFILQKVDLQVQNKVLDKVEKWQNNLLQNYLPLFVVIARELLSPTYEGHSGDHRTITFHFGSLKPTNQLKEIRKRVINILMASYKSLDSLEDKRQILSTLEQATITPNQAKYGPDMEQMVKENTMQIGEYYIKILADAKNEIIQEIEGQNVHFLRRFGVSNLPIISAIAEIIANNKDYQIFRTFVGYDGRLNADYDFEKDQRSRTEQVKEYIASISDDTFEEWKRHIYSVVENYKPQDPSYYGYFAKFLEELGKVKPSLALRLINDISGVEESKLKPFVINIIAGLWMSKEKRRAKDIINKWISDKKNLEICSYLPVYVNEIDLNLLMKVFKQARSTNNVQALNNIVNSISGNYKKDKKLKSLLLETIKTLTLNKSFSWVFQMWFKSKDILEDLERKDIDVVLENLILVPSIDFQTEEILGAIAKKYPEKIINFFFDRVVWESKINKTEDNRYKAIPYEFYKLKDCFVSQESKVVDTIFTWYSKGSGKKKWLFEWYASLLIEHLFPSFEPGSIIERKLIKLVKQKTDTSRKVFFSILRNYKGEDFLWPVVKSLVLTYYGTKQYKQIEGTLFGYLSQTGVVSGEYGFVEAYTRKKEQLEKYKDKTNTRFYEFVLNYEKALEQQITLEQKRADEQSELHKRTWG